MNEFEKIEAGEKKEKRVAMIKKQIDPSDIEILMSWNLWIETCQAN